MPIQAQNASQDRVPQILFFAIFSSMFVYAGVLHLILPKEEWTTAAFWPTSMEGIVPVLMMLAGVLWVVANVLPVRMREAQLRALPVGSPPSARKGIVLTSLIIRWALLEAIALVGFLLAFLEKAPNYMIPLLALAATTLLASFPSAERLEHWANSPE